MCSASRHFSAGRTSVKCSTRRENRDSPRTGGNNTGSKPMSFDFTRRNFLATGAAAATLPLIGTQASAQAGWPNKPIKIISGYPAGGQTDLFARTYGDVIAKKV